MYETYLQNEREFEEKFDIGGFNNILERASPTEFKRFNHLSLIKVMKALEKELEESRLSDYIGREAVCHNNGLQLSLDKIREFISKLEKEV